MERLHLQQFITILEEVYGNEIKTIVNSFIFEDLGATLKDPILTFFLNKYEVFRTKTLRREYGSCWVLDVLRFFGWPLSQVF